MPQPAPLDGRLVSRLPRFRNWLLEVLWRRYKDSVGATAHKAVYNPSDTEDVVQAVFLALCSQEEQVLARFRTEVGGWLTTVTRRCSIKANSVPARLRPLEALDMDPPDRSSADDTVELSEHHRSIFWDEIEKLPDKRRVPLVGLPHVWRALD